MLNKLILKVTANEPNEEALRFRLTQNPELTKQMVFSLLYTKRLSKTREILDLLKDNRNNLDKIHDLLSDYVEYKQEDIDRYALYHTPRSIVNQMLDTLPNEVWSNPNLKWLDPCAGLGIIVIEVIKRLMVGLVEYKSNPIKRYKHIVENMIYAYDSYEDNAFVLSMVLDPSDTLNLNVKNIDYLNHKEDIKFDITLLTAPFKSVSITAPSTPIYSKFILKALTHSKKIVSINPAIWSIAGKGLAKLRRKVLGKSLVRTIKDVDTSLYKRSKITSKVHILFIDKDYNGLANINNSIVDLSGLDIIPTDTKSFSIIDKIKSSPSLKNITKFGTFMGIDYRKGREDRLLDYKPDDTFIKCYVSRIKNLVNYINPDLITKNKQYISSNKVITEALSTDGFGETFIVEPNEVSSDAYLTFIVSNSLEAKNLVVYLKTKFARYLINLRKLTLHNTKDTLTFIPLVDLTIEWTDAKLFKHFNFSPQEISLVLN